MLRRMLNAFLYAALGASIIINVYQAERLRTRSQSPANSLKTGASLPPLRAKDLNGLPVTLLYGDTDKPTVLYVFKPSCPWCKKNEDSIRSLVREAGERYRFVALSLSSDGLKDYLHAYDSGIATVYTEVAEDTQTQYRLWSTPTTLVISPRGRLLSIWVGAFVGDTRTQIEHFFSIGLPRIDAARPAGG
jgi:peroxiredoxin